MRWCEVGRAAVRAGAVTECADRNRSALLWPDMESYFGPDMAWRDEGDAPGAARRPEYPDQGGDDRSAQSDSGMGTEAAKPRSLARQGHDDAK